MKGCPECRAFHAAQTALDRDLRETAAQQRTATPELAADILESLPAPGGMDRPPIVRQRRCGRRMLAAAMLAVVGALVITAIVKNGAAPEPAFHDDVLVQGATGTFAVSTGSPLWLARSMEDPLEEELTHLAMDLEATSRFMLRCLSVNPTSQMSVE